MDYDLALMTGVDIPIAELQLTLHQPTVKEISMMGEKEFFSGIQYICIDKKMYQGEEGKNLLEEINNFQLFMNIIAEKTMAKQKQYIFQCLMLLFPDYSVNLIPGRTLLFNHEGVNITIDESNFELFQETLKKVFRLDGKEEDKFNPVNDKAAEIAKKLQRGRDRVTKEKAAKGEGGSSLKQYISILTIGLNSMSLEDVCNLTVYQVYTLMERYSLFVNWDLDVRTRLAGGSPDSHPDNWMKNI